MKKRYGLIEFLDKYSKRMIEKAKQYGDKKIEKMFDEILFILKKYKSN